jgi:hypothetical protein
VAVPVLCPPRKHERTITVKRPKRRYPITFARYFNLQGGNYGTIDLVAPDDEHLELQLGGDFVRLTQKQTIDLRAGLQAFLDLECEWSLDTERFHPDEPRESGGLGKAIKDIAGEVAEAIGVRAPESEPPSDEPRRRRR